MGTGRIPGPIGRREGGTVAKTRGPTGRPRNRTAHKRGPAGLPRPPAVPKDPSKESRGGTSRRRRKEFKADVLRKQIAREISQGKVRLDAIPDAELEIVEGDKCMRKVAAASCRRLLADARTALAEAKASGDASARRTRSIGLCSAYRTYEYETGLWNGAFNKHFKKMVESKVFAGDEYGEGAERHMVVKLGKVKAAPGFSNHSDGKAVDFATTYDGQELVANTDQIAAWRKAWLYRWLVANGARYGFKQLPTEEWHWDYIG